MAKRRRSKHSQDVMKADGDARRKEKHNHNNGRRTGTRSSMLAPSCKICLRISEFVKNDSSRGNIDCDECNAEIKKDEARFTCSLHIFNEDGEIDNERSIWDRCIDCNSKVEYNQYISHDKVQVLFALCSGFIIAFFTQLFDVLRKKRN